MDIGVVRDLIIIIAGVLLLVLLIIGGIFVLQLYREVKTLSASVKNTIDIAKQMGSEVRQALKNSGEIIQLVKEIRKKSEAKPPAAK